MPTPEELEAATRRVNDLSKPPSTDDMLLLYGFFKQANVGDVKGSRPGLLDVRGRAKFDAWAKCRGMTLDAARAAYIALAQRLGA